MCDFSWDPHMGFYVSFHSLELMTVWKINKNTKTIKYLQYIFLIDNFFPNKHYIKI